jgi:hypothetical protein
MSEETPTNEVPIDTTVQETIALVKEAHSKGVFNLSEVIKGRGYPSKDATIYLDADAAFRLSEIDDELNNYLDEDLREKLEVEATELAEKVKSSALIFTMRGVSQKIVEDIIKKSTEKYPNRDDDQSEDAQLWVRHYIASLIASNLIRVTTADGSVDEHVFTPEEMLELRETVAQDSWNVLVETMQRLTLASGYFDQLTDAGFLPRS